MAQYPRKDAESRTGSNIPGNPLIAHRQAQLAREKRAREQLVKQYVDHTNKLISQDDFRRAGEFRERTKRDWHQASVRLAEDAGLVVARKNSARAGLARKLAREVAGYRQWQALRNAHLTAQDKVTQAGFAARRFPDANIDWGDVVAVEPGSGQMFVPPFTTFDVQLIDWGGFVVKDDSFAKPDIGHVVNDFAFDQDESTSIVAGAFGILPIENATSLASCGVGFTVPSAGRLAIGAVLRNFYNRVTLSVEDNFGFSSANVGITLSLFAAVVRGSVVEIMSKDLQTTSLKSDGDDKSYNGYDLDNSTPYSISVQTQTRYEANEQVLVLAGSEVLMGTLLDDMHCKMSALTWWKLEKLYIDMAVDVIT